MSVDGMIDIEGLSLAPDAHVLSVGIVSFDLEGILAKAYWKVSPAGQQGRSVSASTALWWIGQAIANPEAATAIAGEHGTHVDDMLRGLQQFVHENHISNIWANGVDYDLVVLESLYAARQLEVPWGYRDRSDFRTVRKLVKQFNIPIELDDGTFEGIEHNALDDAMWQTKYLIAARKALGLV